MLIKFVPFFVLINLIGFLELIIRLLVLILPFLSLLYFCLILVLMKNFSVLLLMLFLRFLSFLHYRLLLVVLSIPFFLLLNSWLFINFLAILSFEFSRPYLFALLCSLSCILYLLIQIESLLHANILYVNFLMLKFAIQLFF